MGFENMPQSEKEPKSPELEALLEKVKDPNKKGRQFLAEAIEQLEREDEILEFYEAYAQSIIREFPEEENPEHIARQNISYFLMNLGGEEKKLWDSVLPDPEATLRKPRDPNSEYSKTEHWNILED